MSLRTTALLATALAGAVSVATSPASAAAGAAAPSTQTIRVETPGCATARCEASNDKGRWTLERTPGTLAVATSSEPLVIVCGEPAAASPLGPTRVPAEKGKSEGTATIAGSVAGAALGIAAIAAAAAVPFALPGAIQLLVPAMTAGAGMGAMVDEAGRPVSYPEVISVPLACYPPAVSESELASAPLGVAVRGLTLDEAAAAGLTAGAGAIVTRTAPGSRAERSGLRVGDVVVACDGAKVAGAAELEAMVRGAGTDRQLSLRVLRDRQTVEATVPGAASEQ